MATVSDETEIDGRRVLITRPETGGPWPGVVMLDEIFGIKLRQALTTNRVPHDLKTYPTAGHSFLNDEAVGPRILRPLMKVAHVGPDPVAAPDAWQRIEAFFAEHLPEQARPEKALSDAPTRDNPSCMT